MGDAVSDQHDAYTQAESQRGKLTGSERAPDQVTISPPDLLNAKGRKCEATKSTGERCKAYAVKGKPYCAGHLGLGKLDPHRAAAISAQVRRDTAEHRKMGTRAALTAAAERLQDEIVAAYEAGLKSEDPTIRVRSADALLNRVFGKPKETIETVEVPEDLQRLQEMSPDEIAELWARLQVTLQ